MFFSVILTYCILFKTISTSVTPTSKNMVSILNITESKQTDGVCILDYSLRENFKALPVPPWLKKWDDILPNTFCKDKYDIKVHKDYDAIQIARRLLFSLASGFGIDSWHDMTLQKRFGHSVSEEMMETLWHTGQMQQSDSTEQDISNKFTHKSSLKKRTIVEFFDPTWEYLPGNRARVYVLKSLQKDMEEQGDNIIELRASGI